MAEGAASTPVVNFVLPPVCEIQAARVTEIEIERAEHPGGSSAPAGRLEELKRLHDQRLITDEEYEVKRRQILDRL